MTTDENIMDEMLDRATNPARDTDELSLQMFCMVVRSNSQLVEKALDKVVAKIRSTDVTEATRAIALLEECMTKCGGEFQDEVSKFRFLNQLIRLVSKKYQGAETSTAIKQRIMECLLLWTTEFPQRTKIREVYDMLRKEGDVGDHGNSPAAVAKRESVLGIDEAMLSKLINSGDPENFKRANLLIQYRVNQESRRTELTSQQKSVLQEVNNTVGLLNQMLDTYESDGGVSDTSDNNETVNLIRELFMACKKHKPILQRLPELIENSDEDLIADTLETNDLLLAVMKRYKNAIVHASATKTPTTTTANSADLLAALLEDAPTCPQSSVMTANSNELLVASNVSSASTTPLKTQVGITKATSSNTLDELHDIFGDAMVSTDTKETKNFDEIFRISDLLEPVNVFKSSENGDANQTTTEKRAFRELPAIDQISEDLFKKSLQAQERVGSFKKEPEKYTLNDLAKEKMQVKPATPTKALVPDVLNEFENAPTPKLETKEPSRHEDDLMLSTESVETPSLPGNSAGIKDTEVIAASVTPPTTKSVLHFKHLSDIAIDLDDVTPTAEERILLEDDDIKLTLNFTTDCPSKNVSVIVISASNKSKMPLKDFHFEASVKKPCKVRLLPATGSAMPPYKPFRPAAPINQVLLLLNPTSKDVDVTCIVGYKLGDDPDEIKESIVAKSIPYVA